MAAVSLKLSPDWETNRMSALLAWSVSWSTPVATSQA